MTCVARLVICSRDLPQVAFGPDQFGHTRWLLAALLVLFTWFLLSLFSRLTAMVPGVIGGPVLSGKLGYLLFPAFITQAQTAKHPDPHDGALGLGKLLIPGVLLALLALNPLLWSREPRVHAYWTACVFPLVPMFGRATERA